MAHWCESFIGKPWQAGARGPDAYDCWGLLMAAERLFDVELPDTFDGVDWVEFGKCWDLAAMPVEGDAVLMRRPGHPHVGVWVAANGGRVLHAMEHVGVVLSDTVYLRMQGWRPRYYRYVRTGPTH